MKIFLIFFRVSDWLVRLCMNECYLKALQLCKGKFPEGNSISLNVVKLYATLKAMCEDAWSYMLGCMLVKCLFYISACIPAYIQRPLAMVECLTSEVAVEW